jgi:hypothetical protein
LFYTKKIDQSNVVEEDAEKQIEILEKKIEGIK